MFVATQFSDVVVFAVVVVVPISKWSIGRSSGLFILAATVNPWWVGKLLLRS